MMQRIRQDRTVAIASVIAGGMFAVVLIFFAIAKLTSFSYNALDLGIFSQVINGLANGRWFAFTIHPHSYLGDHFDLFLVVLAPVFAVARTPATLVVLQILAITLSIWPLLLLARRHLPASWQWIVILVFVLSPSLHNVALFEFHELPFAIPLLLVAILMYEQRRFGWYCFLLVITMAIREDLGLVVLGMGVLALVERRSFRWSVVPMFVGLVWFIFATAMTGYFNGEQYKFLSYYGWLGATPQEVLRNALLQPWRVILKILRLQNLAFLAAILLQFSALPLFAIRRLVPAVFVLAALLLTGIGADALTLFTHYPALMLPFLFWAFLLGLQRMIQSDFHRIRRYIENPRSLSALLLVVVAVYWFFTFSPLRPAGFARLSQARSDPLTAAYQELVKEVPADVPVAASFASLPFLSIRDSLYSVHYAFRGKRQLSQTPYALPDNTDWILYDGRDFLFYTLQYQQDSVLFNGGDDRLRALLGRGFRLVDSIDSLLLYTKKDGLENTQLYSVGTLSGRPFADNDAGRPIRLVAVDGQEETVQTATRMLAGAPRATIPVTLTWQTDRALDLSYHLRVEYMDSRGRVAAETRFPIGYGLFPTTEWPVNTPIRFHYDWLVPKIPAGTYTVRLALASMKGYATLDEKLSAALEVSSEEQLGAPIALGSVTLR
ncbi:MAG: DUF2079 domain-containing protein [Candidatus Kerfeldbacteria bacterium]|nr:DUF2079 domain-containing protein [Candidatus Kerfeldbacteria bacterium]